jgi:hypothetical protein
MGHTFKQFITFQLNLDVHPKFHTTDSQSIQNDWTSKKETKIIKNVSHEVLVFS